MSIRHGKPTDSARTAGAEKPKTAYVGKNRYSISIVQLAKVSEIVCRKKAGSDFLTSSVSSISGGHNVSDLITLVDKEVPIYNYFALQDE